jgi:hypothetical protein
MLIEGGMALFKSKSSLWTILLSVVILSFMATPLTYGENPWDADKLPGGKDAPSTTTIEKNQIPADSDDPDNSNAHSLAIDLWLSYRVSLWVVNTFDLTEQESSTVSVENYSGTVTPVKTLR